MLRESESRPVHIFPRTKRKSIQVKEFNREITYPTICLIFGLLGAFLILSGCATKSVHRHIPTSLTDTSTSSRCKIVGKSVGKYSSVVVRKDCLRKGLTEVTILLHGVKRVEGQSREKKMRVAQMGVIEATKSVIKILGFRPSLSALAITKYKGIPCYVFAVVGIAPTD